ncbi:MAG TPA: hypothetical protein VER79_08095 [Candidatus Limnocylindrales bacterium]|nr:hypothetical protein [Candidatus Limnocylindrales bacterium]
MENLVFLIEQLATALYVLLGTLLVFMLWRLNRTRQVLRSSQYELERSMARDRRDNALTGVVLVAEALLIVVGLQQIVAPALRETLNLSITQEMVMDDGVFNTPTPQPVIGDFQIDTSGVQLGEVNPANQILPTPTLTPTPVGTIVPNSPAPVGCDTPNAQLQVPANGMIVFEPIVVLGTASIENFAFYRLELKGPSTSDNFAPLPGEGTQAVPVVGELGQFVPSFYLPGEYRFRLVVFDATNAVKASCELTIFISEPIATATPLAP